MEVNERIQTENKEEDDAELSPTKGDIKEDEAKEEKKDKKEKEDPLAAIVRPADATEKEISQIEAIIMRETGHAQWLKQIICIVLIVMLIGMNLMMGSTTRESVVGISKCSIWWWLVQLAFIVICVLLTIVSVVVAKSETALKKKFGGVGMCDSDLDLS